MTDYTDQEIQRMGRGQLIELIDELKLEIDELHELLQNALDELESSD